MLNAICYCWLYQRICPQLLRCWAAKHSSRSNLRERLYGYCTNQSVGSAHNKADRWKVEDFNTLIAFFFPGFLWVSAQYTVQTYIVFLCFCCKLNLQSMALRAAIHKQATISTKIRINLLFFCLFKFYFIF